jgi:hypothetical protein
MPSKGRRAVIVFHGIGEHKEFETLDLVASALSDLSGSGDDCVSLAKAGTDPLAFSTIELPHAEGPIFVDLYEGYWSPLTKGKASAWAIIVFLIEAGLRGIGQLIGRKSY